jgi:hypothetical protein
MKLSSLFKISAAASLLFAASTVSAKDYTITGKAKIDTAVVDSSITIGINVTNTSSSAIQIHYDIIHDNLDSIGWNYQVCDFSQCYPIGQQPYTKTLTMDAKPKPGYAGIFEVLINSFNGRKIKGGNFVLRFYEVGKENEADTFQVNIDARRVSIQELTDRQVGISVFPNPAKNNITISGNNNFKPVRANIYNLVGQKVAAYQFAQNSALSIDLSSFQAGTYVLQLQDNSGRTYSKMIGKE